MPLHVAHAIRSDGFAGVERYVSMSARRLAQLGHEVTVVGGQATRMRTELSGTAVTFIPAATTLEVWRALVGLRDRPDLIHAHMTAAELAAIGSRVRRQRPIVATLHFAAQRGATVPGRAIRPFVRRFLTEQLAISDFVRTASGERATVLRLGVEAQDPVEAVNRVILVAQRLEREKQTALAIEAFERTTAARDGWQLWIAGDGDERDALEQRAASTGLDIRFLGHRQDVDVLRRSAGIGLATAPAEPLGLSVIEAMAQGLPVVAAGGGGHLETIGKARPDLLFAPGDPTACASVIDHLAASPDLRRTAGSAVRAHQQEHLRLDDHVDGVLDVYHRVVEEARGGSRS